MLWSRLGLAVLLASSVVACAQEAQDDERVSSDDAALTALEDQIGFDGALARLDENALVQIDREASDLKARGADAVAIERATTRRVLTEARTRGGQQRSTTGTGTGTGIGTRSVYDWDLFNLNGQERALCKNARFVCVRVAIAGLRARSASQAEYDDGNVGGRIDAFRHTYWNALMSGSVGESHAKAWADAHENGYPENRATPANRILSDMDFHNNAEGRRIGLEDGDAKDGVRSALTSGVLRAVRYDLDVADGVLVPSSQCSATVVCGH